LVHSGIAGASQIFSPDLINVRKLPTTAVTSISDFHLSYCVDPTQLYRPPVSPVWEYEVETISVSMSARSVAVVRVSVPVNGPWWNPAMNCVVLIGRSAKRKIHCKYETGNILYYIYTCRMMLKNIWWFSFWITSKLLHEIGIMQWTSLTSFGANMVA
jgi:hypothetical protein